MSNNTLNGHNGRKAHYIVAGDGPPVVLIHGIGGSLHHWDLLIPELVKAGYRAYALDLLGHGESIKPQDAKEYHVEELYTHAAEWIDSLGCEQPIYLAGHSMGGFVSLNYALRNPGKIRRMVLVDPFYSPKQASPFLKLAGRNPEMSKRILDTTPRWLVKPMVRGNKNIAKNASPDTVRRMAQDYKRADPNILYIAPSTWDLTPQLSAVRQETLLIWGEKDQTLSPKSFPKMAERLPNCETHSYSNCGHTPHLTNAASFNEKVLHFLQRD
jgi:pimeloyl-ACP methyl ester carboxylesterase